MTDRLHLETQHRSVLEALVEKHLPGVEVWAYGSCINGSSHNGSHLNLVLRGAGLKEIPAEQLVDFEEAVRESRLPFLVEARDWARLSEQVRGEIERGDVCGVSEGFKHEENLKNWLYSPQFPGHWKRVSLYSMASWTNGLAFRNIEFNSTGKPVIKIAEIKGGISSQTKFTHQNFDESVRIQPGDLLFSWSGQPETSIDAFWWRGTEGWLNQHVFRVTPIDSIDKTFFFYILQYLKPNFIALGKNKQTVGLGHVTKSDLRCMDVGFPDLPEQHAIAHILGTLDDKIELNRRMNEALEAMAQAIFKDWFVDFGPVRAKAEGRSTGLPDEIDALFPDSFEDSELGEVPRGWLTGNLFMLGKLNPESWSVRQHPNNVEYADLSGVKNGLIEETSFYAWDDAPSRARRVLRNGDTIVGTVRPGNHSFSLIQKSFHFSVTDLFRKIASNKLENKILSELRDALLPKLLSGEICVDQIEKTMEVVA